MRYGTSKALMHEAVFRVNPKALMHESVLLVSFFAGGGGVELVRPRALFASTVALFLLKRKRKSAMVRVNPGGDCWGSG